MLETIAQLRTLLRGIWNYRWTGLITAATVGLIGGLLSIFWPAKYEASARVFVDTQSILKSALINVAVPPNAEQQVAMVARTLISRPNVAEVMNSAQLNLNANDSREREKIIDDLIKDIEFKSSGSPNAPNLFTLSYKHHKPETAKAVIQRLQSIFVETSLKNSRVDADSGRRFLDDQIKDYEQKLLLSENALKEFKIKNMGLVPGAGGGDYFSRLQDIEAQVRQARFEVKQSESARDSVKRQLSGESPTLGQGDETIVTNPVTGAKIKTDIEERLEAAKKRLDEFRSRYTEEHPDVIGTRRIVETLEQQRKDEIKAFAANPGGAPGTTITRSTVSNPVYKELRVQLADAESTLAIQRSKLSEYENRLARTQETASAVPKVEAEFTQLTRDYESNKLNHRKLIDSRESVSITNAMASTAGVAEIRVIDPPRVSPRPASPNRFVLLIASLLAALGAGFGAALMRDQSKPTFFDVRALRTFTGMPLLGGVSYVTNAVGRAKSRMDILLFSAGASAMLLCFIVAIAYFGYKQYAA
jgi:polysaccharide chain length determinant protein (PEP-CTERM system associated)